MPALSDDTMIRNILRLSCKLFKRHANTANKPDPKFCRLVTALGFAALSGCVQTNPEKSGYVSRPDFAAPICGCDLVMDATYLVFFDWNKYNLRPTSIAIIALVAADDKRLSFGRIHVVGYTDTSGPSEYNTRLSLKRALAVEDQLVADGVSKSRISIRGYGPTHLLVPSGPNVRVENNRRVEIMGDKPR